MVQPTLPKDIEKFDAGAHNENSLQLKKAPACKLQKKELKEAKLIELDIRRTNDNKAWKDIFDSVPVRSLKPKGNDDTSPEVIKYFEKMSGETFSENLLNNNLAIWCQAMQNYSFHKTEKEIDDKLPFGISRGL